MYLILFDQHHMQVNPKAAESLADPVDYPNLFEDWQVGLAIESKVAETRCHCMAFCYIDFSVFI